MTTFESAEIVRTPEGRQYHIGLASSEVAPTCVLVGDPARAGKVAARFDAGSIRYHRTSREYVAYTGAYQGIPLTVLATGIGNDNTEIAIVEYCQLVERPTFIRCGSSGALQPPIALGDLVISTGAVRLDNTTSYFVVEGYPALAHHEVTLALIEACEAEGVRYHMGITASAPGFYGAQARQVPGFPVRFPDLPQQLERMNVANFEMETSALFVLASLRGVRAGAVCAVYANRHENRFIDTDSKDRAEARCIGAGLRAVVTLAAMDRARGEAARWRPSHGLK